jgi:hypothetical protein
VPDAAVTSSAVCHSFHAPNRSLGRAYYLRAAPHLRQLTQGITLSLSLVTVTGVIGYDLAQARDFMLHQERPKAAVITIATSNAAIEAKDLVTGTGRVKAMHAVAANVPATAARMNDRLLAFMLIPFAFQLRSEGGLFLSSVPPR